MIGIGMTSRRTRERLIARLRDYGICNTQVLAAIQATPRHLFVDEALESRAYENTALPIGKGQTISQPYIVARMTECLLEGRTNKPGKVLEIGTGSGYQTAVLAQIFENVYTVERISSFRYPAKRRFHKMGLYNIHNHHADGHSGWAQHSPYDAIIVTAAATHIPEELLNQLDMGGVMVIPVVVPNDEQNQDLIRIAKTREGYTRECLESVRFVPLLGDCC